jgi:ABC-type nickel/cobalt efflux system permease component RcnA
VKTKVTNNMAKNSKALIVFALGMFLVSLWCMKVTEAHGDHHEAQHAGCSGKNSDAGEECTDEDDALGLYADIDDTFRNIKRMAHKVHHHGHHDGLLGGDNEDSPDVAHNNVDVLGH